MFEWLCTFFECFRCPKSEVSGSMGFILFFSRAPQAVMQFLQNANYFFFTGQGEGSVGKQLLGCVNTVISVVQLYTVCDNNFLQKGHNTDFFQACEFFCDRLLHVISSIFFFAVKIHPCIIWHCFGQRGYRDHSVAGGGPHGTPDGPGPQSGDRGRYVRPVPGDFLSHPGGGTECPASFPE